MLRVHTLPGSLLRVLEPFRPCFTTPTFATFVTLLAGMVARPAHRTVCGMLAGAGLAGIWHHSRAHRFFAGRWSRYSPLRPVAPSTWSATAPTCAPNSASCRRT
jgi:hypothetical protein